MTATDSFEIGTVSYENVKSVALFSDGLLENRFMDVPEHKDMMYGLIGDNCRFVNLHSFLDSTVSSYEDDITFVYINSHEEFGFDELEIKPDFKNVLEYVNGVEESLSRYGLSVSDTATVTGLMTELVMNAFEHGCLEIELEEKTAMITEGAYDEYLIKAEAPHGKKIHIKTGTFPSCGSMVFCAEITDNGKGFNFRRKRKSKKSLFGGNGIKMVSSAVDEIYFNEKGNSVRIYKILK
jgi:anti-sigma regulatory factor (Ser/Thr protein kinase)